MRRNLIIFIVVAVVAGLVWAQFERADLFANLVDATTTVTAGTAVVAGTTVTAGTDLVAGTARVWDNTSKQFLFEDDINQPYIKDVVASNQLITYAGSTSTDELHFGGSTSTDVIVVSSVGVIFNQAVTFISSFNGVQGTFSGSMTHTPIAASSDALLVQNATSDNTLAIKGDGCLDFYDGAGGTVDVSLCRSAANVIGTEGSNDVLSQHPETFTACSGSGNTPLYINVQSVAFGATFGWRMREAGSVTSVSMVIWNPDNTGTGTGGTPGNIEVEVRADGSQVMETTFQEQNTAGAVESETLADRAANTFTDGQVLSVYLNESDASTVQAYDKICVVVEVVYD